MSFYDNSPGMVDDLLTPLAEGQLTEEQEREQIAQRIYAQPEAPKPSDEIGDELKQERNDPARRMFSPQVTYRDAVTTPENPELAVELREVFADVQLSEPEARTVMDLGRRTVENPPTDEQVAAWRTESNDVLRREFGGDAGAALADAQQLVARDQFLGRLLEATGLGNHPDVIRTLCTKARSLRLAGRLK